MPTYRCPVLIWKNSAGLSGTLPAWWSSMIARWWRQHRGRHWSSFAVYWTGSIERNPGEDPPDLKDPVLEVFKVPVRPEYQDEATGRRYPIPGPLICGSGV